jgi:hypothetical protein
MADLPRVADVAVANGGRTALSASSLPCLSVLVQCHPGHTGAMRVGGSDVNASSGTYLRPGDAVSLTVDDVSRVHAWGLAADAVACVTVDE